MTSTGVQPRRPGALLSEGIAEWAVGRVGDRGLAAMVAGSFCLVIAGPNLPTALLPSYREAYRLSPFGLSVLFAAYLMLLVPTLLACTGPWFRARTAVLLPAGLLAAVCADVLMLTGSSSSMLVYGRALSGISVALSTGSAAAFMVGLRGERGRGAVATGNIAGALFGTVAAVLLAQAGIGPVIYLAHGVLVLIAAAVLSAVLAARVRFAPARRVGAATNVDVDVADGSDPKLPAAVTEPRLIRRHLVLGFAVGAVGWAIPGLVTGLVPALLRQLTGPSAVIVATSPAIVLLASAWGLQVLARSRVMRWVRGYELTVGTVMGAVGLALLTAGALTASVPLVYAGCIVAAGGPALGYRGGMMLLTRGLDAARQSAMTSGYAASSYGIAAAVVLGAGYVGTLGGLVSAVAIGAGLLGFAAVTLIGIILVTER